jgi:signal transduction histidine kinase
MTPTEPQTRLLDASVFREGTWRGQWLGWSPKVVGLITGLLFALPSLAVIWNMHVRASQLLEQSMRNRLLAAARSAANVVDAELHGSFQSREQEGSAAYQAEIGKLARMKAALDVEGMIRFVYTCVEREGRVWLVLDPTPAGDADGDGQEDKAHIMQSYDAASETLKQVLATGVAAVDAQLYSDPWGTFLSGYAPVRNARNELVAVAGVDLALEDYEKQLGGIRQVSSLSTLGAMMLALLIALLMAGYHRRLQRTVAQLVVARDAALDAARAKGQFLAAMSHELRTPMNAVIGMSGMLADTQLDGNQREFVETIQRSGENLLEMISDILDYSSLEAGSVKVEARSVAVREMVEKLQKQFGPVALQKGLGLGVLVAEACPAEVRVDGARLRQVVRHLLGNAVKFTEAGQIRLEVEMRTPGWLQVRVSDTGPGIPLEKQAALKESFLEADYTSTRSQGGIGMGLALCHQLARLMGGSLELKSAPGRGSVFVLELPVEVVVERRGVVLVTGDRLTGTLVRSFFEKHGRTVRTVATAEGLREALENEAAGLVLVDLRAPGGEGLVPDGGGQRWIGLNADNEDAGRAGFEALLPMPVTPAALRGLL